ncbi:MAG: UDP-N-acetylglucosamine 4,6-dehydratase (inverting) [Methyloceanibacter sp.]
MNMLFSQVPILSSESRAYLKGRRVLVTGGTGSFGRRFVRTLLEEAVDRLVVYSRDEHKHADTQLEMRALDRRGVLQFCLGDVRDTDRLEMALRGIDTVVHAAALKHVPAGEFNPSEFIRTNALGADSVVRASMRAGVENVITLSSDKAVNPISLYGASKLAADKVFVAANIHAGNTGPRFSVVRYGNVLDSRGGVASLFSRLASNGADSLPITDSRMTRFWITLAQGVQLVCSCLPIMKGGEIFVAKVPSMKITDLARAIAPNLPHKIVGIRPGEKLHETLITEMDARKAFDLGDRFVVEPVFDFWKSGSHLNGPTKPLPADFRYTSDTNQRWLTIPDIAELLQLSSLSGLATAETG